MGTTPTNCDFLWMSSGGLFIDGSGDLAVTVLEGQSDIDIIRSRLKAALNGWQSYQIGADLESFIGQATAAELETQIQQKVMATLTYQFLSSGNIKVKTRTTDGQVKIYVYYKDTIAATATVGVSGNQLLVQTNF